MTVHCTVGGDARVGVDYVEMSGDFTIPVGETSVTLSLVPSPRPERESMVVVTLKSAEAGYHVGCQSASLVVIRKAKP